VKRFLFLGLIAMSPPANAQIAPGRSGTSSQYTITGQQAWNELASFGICYASSEQENALKLVATPAGTIEEAKVYKELFKSPDQGCLGDISSMDVPWQYVRGAIAEGFYTKRIAVPANLAVAAPMAREKVQNMSDMAICYVAGHVAAARALIEDTRPGSKSANAALEAMLPDLIACIPPNPANNPQFDPMIVRYRIAEAMWRLGMVKGQSGSSAGATN
jgi:hypothetical protein